MPEYKLVGAHRDSGEAVKVRVNQPDEAAVIRLAEKRGILVTSITEIPPSDNDLGQLARSAFASPDNVQSGDEIPVSIEPDIPVDVPPATQPDKQPSAKKVPKYAVVQFCALMFSVVGAGIFLMAMLFLVAGISMIISNGFEFDAIMPFLMCASLMLVSAFWLGAGFMMEMLRDLTRHVLTQL